MKILGVLSILLLALTLGVLTEASPVASIAIEIESLQPLGEDEVVTLVNRGDSAVDLTGWRLESSNSLGQEVKETFWFPGRCLLPAGGTLKIHSGSYARGWGDRSCGHQQIDLPWTEVKIWNDDADVAWLRDPSGELIDLYTYTATASAESRDRPRPSFRPKPRSEIYHRWPEPERKGERYCPSCYPADGGCCAVEVILVSIEPVYNRGVGENWRFFASAGRMEPPVFPGNLPQVVYEDHFRGELWLELGAGAVEEDGRPDRGWAARTVRLRCSQGCQEQTITIEVQVRENEGCYIYIGCTALWRFLFKVVVEPAFVPTAPPSLAPSADFTVSPPGVHRVGDVVTLDGSPSKGEELSYEWDFDGDGQADARGTKVTHRLAYEGVNLITLTVTDRSGQSDSITRGIRVIYKRAEEKGIDLGLFWLTLPALAVGYFLVMAFRG